MISYYQFATIRVRMVFSSRCTSTAVLNNHTYTWFYKASHSQLHVIYN